MAVNPDIRDQAYKFFSEEAPELLQVLETGLLTLREERSNRKVHDLMRTSHSIKGGAAGVGLEAIATLAHRLETIFKALYNEALEIDNDLESQLLQAYDCLRLPLTEQITTGQFDPEQAISSAEPVFAQIEEQLGDALTQAEYYDVPSSAELGVDMTLSIFEVDVPEGLEHLTKVLASPEEYQVAEELRGQAEMFAELAEILSKPGLGAIAEAVLAALNTNPQQELTITQLALVDFQVYREALLAGNESQAGTPSAGLLALAEEQAFEFSTEQEHWGQNFSEDLFAQVNQQENSLLEEQQFQFPIPENPHLEQETLAFSAESPEDIFASMSSAEQVDTEETNFPLIIDGEFADEEIFTTQEVEKELSSLEDIFSGAVSNAETEAAQNSSLFQITSALKGLQQGDWAIVESTDTSETSTSEIQSVENLEPASFFQEISPSAPQLLPSTKRPQEVSTTTEQQEAAFTPKVSVRVDSDRLERMNNLVGEAAINRSGLFLENRQLQGSVRELLSRFTAVEQVVDQLRKVSDQTLVPELSRTYGTLPTSVSQMGEIATSQADFDSLEMDNYGALHTLLQRFVEDMVQLKESVDDIALFAKQSDRNLEQLRKMLTHLQDELMWARMLPLGEVLNRFPRILRDLSSIYHKRVGLKLSGKGVLVDKAVLEKIYDPLLHLLRNAFDHGIEFPNIRLQQGKPEQGQIEIKAYHQGGQTIIEVKDDGQGVNLERISRRVLDLGWLTAEQLASVPEHRLLDLIFEPGFSTAEQVSELSGRGVGLDVVRSQLRTLKGNITVTSKPGVGTTFTLHLPLTLTSAKLLVGLVESTTIALPSDSLEEIVVPKADQIKKTGAQRFLRWRGQIVPIYRLAELLEYACPVPENPLSRALGAESSPSDLIPPLLILERGQQVFALEIDHLVTEQKLVIKPFGAAIAPPPYTYGCTILGDGSLIPVIDGAALLDRLLTKDSTAITTTTESEPELYFNLGSDSATIANNNWPISKVTALSTTAVGGSLIDRDSIFRTINVAKRAPTKVLIVDDAVSLRRTLALSLERAGYRVLQAGDGWEALKQLQHSSDVKLVICDIEMPNMNGFDFMNHRRRDPKLQQIPVVMLTSRSNDKHRRLAMHLGATDYFTKPYIEQGFLKAIQDIIIINS
ncbi:response regulator [Lyngbya aestuarii]|uniref:response regulator n=1 Tax=Lyngbya aestuarii TaxID=118322 RepID=UPI00403DDD4B